MKKKLIPETAPTTTERTGGEYNIASTKNHDPTSKSTTSNGGQGQGQGRGGFWE